MKKISEEDLLKIKLQIAHVTNYYRKKYNVGIATHKSIDGLILTMTFDKRFYVTSSVKILTEEFEDVYVAFGADGFTNYWQNKLERLIGRLNCELLKYGVQI